MPNARFILDEQAAYEGPEPYFYNPEDFPWAKKLEAGWQIIREEFAPIIDGQKEISLSSVNPPYLSHPGAWKNIYFWNFMWQYHDNCRLFPKTYSFLQSIPNLTFAAVTVLEPHSRVLPHYGETNTTIRGHLGLSIPASLPIAGIRVGEEEKSWETGKVVLFSDCHRHTVWNDSNNRRFVLVFDITKPEYTRRLLWTNAQSIAALTIKFIDAKRNILCRLPRPLLHVIHQSIAALWWMYLPLQRSRRLFYTTPKQ